MIGGFIGSPIGAAIGETTYALTATGIVTGAPTIGTPIANSTNALEAVGITVTGSPTLGSPSLTDTFTRNTAVTSSRPTGTNIITLRSQGSSITSERSISSTTGIVRRRA